MYPAAFDYYAPKHIKEVLGLLGKLKDDAKILAGGHSLIPMMKLRLAQPKHLVDLRKVSGLSGIKLNGKAFAGVGVCAAGTLDKPGTCVKASVAVTGAGTKAVRAKGVEAALVGKKLEAAAIEAAAQKAAEGVDVQADLQGSVEYKAHLCRVFAKRALTEAVKRAGG